MGNKSPLSLARPWRAVGWISTKCLPEKERNGSSTLLCYSSVDLSEALSRSQPHGLFASSDHNKVTWEPYGQKLNRITTGFSSLVLQFSLTI